MDRSRHIWHSGQTLPVFMFQYGKSSGVGAVLSSSPMVVGFYPEEQIVFHFPMQQPRQQSLGLIACNKQSIPVLWSPKTLTSMKNIIYIGLLLASAAGNSLFAQQFPFYITDESTTPYQTNTVFSREIIEKARGSVDSQPAANDPTGHWGYPNEGFQLSIRLDKSTFTNGEPIVASVTLRNVSDKLLWYPVSYGEDLKTKIILYENKERVLPIKQPKGTNFLDRVKAVRSGSEGAWASPAGTQRKFNFVLNEIYDLKPNANYTVQATREIQTIKQDATTDLASSTSSFSVGDARSQK
jgi:hypothetical protein